MRERTSHEVAEGASGHLGVFRNLSGIKDRTVGFLLESVERFVALPPKGQAGSLPAKLSGFMTEDNGKDDL